MPDVYQSYRTFISSPSDVTEERQMTRDVIQRLNRVCRDLVGLSLEARTWEELPPITPQLPEEHIQDILNKEVERSHFFILILFKRYGTIEPGQTKSNTERELDAILKEYERKPQLKILAYFRNLPENADPGGQEQKVRDFRQRLEERGIFYKNYDTPEEFRELITHALYDAVLRLRLSPFKRVALQKFWRIGRTDPPTHPRLAILFPPVSREFMGGSRREAIWLKRMHPNVYYEDYKAIHKVTKTLALIGFHDHRTYFQTDPPPDLALMNRVWMCFARSNQALQRIEAQYRHSRFRLRLRTKPDDEASWIQQDGSVMRIKSPLGLYLKQQRSSMDVSGQWDQHLGKIVCRDFGILARFKDTTVEDRTIEEALHDYYIGGIRGLGTWGAGWFLDRKFRHFLHQQEETDWQFLLEATYHDGRIVDVQDVSNKPREYFAEQLRVKTIRNVIEQYRA